MIKAIRTVLRRLSKNLGGNAAMLVALGLPALIGSGGLAVDVAQWFIWKRELQFAVDQAAIAGAWARADAATINNYQARALQEYDANLQVTDDFATTPAVTLVNYDGGVANAVKVTTTSNQKSLPFTGIFLEEGAQISVTATAVLETGGNWSGCIIALDPSAEGAFTLGGNASGNVAVRRGRAVERCRRGDGQERQFDRTARPARGDRRDRCRFRSPMAQCIHLPAGLSNPFAGVIRAEPGPEPEPDLFVPFGQPRSEPSPPETRSRRRS